MSETDDPFKPSDATVVRPRPGAGRRGMPDPVPGWRPAAPAAARLDPVSTPVGDFVAAGLNPLVQAASSLLVLTGRLRGTLSVHDVAGLRQHALDEIRRFEERARAAGVPNEIVLPARYALCAGLDEAVLSTPWGAHSEWAQQTLLVVLHREAWGGEKFFEMLERSSQDPARFIDLMELQYVCLALGFAGKYHVASRGHAQLADVQQALYRKIRDARGAPPPELSLRWRGLQERRNPVVRYVPWWVVGAASLALVVGTFIVYYTALGRAAGPVEAELARIGLEDFTEPPPAAAPSGPTLKQLLAPEEGRGVVSVEEDGGRTRVRVLAENLFASGSAVVNPAHEGTLQRIGDAIRQVPGRVLVEGHTDDQPIRSLRYRDNVDLSRERAANVATVIKGTLDNPARVVSNGLGSTQPLVANASDARTRARNRRVEIVHVYGS